MSSSPIWRAVTRNPVSFLTSAAPWRALGYLATSGLLGLLSLIVLGGVVVCGLLLSVAGIGLVILAGSVLLGIPLAALERRRLRLLEGPHADRPASPHRAVARPGLWPWLTTRLQESATWREFGFAMVFAVLLSVVDLALLTLAGSLVVLIVFPVEVAVTSGQPEALLLTGLGIAVLPVAAYVLGAAAAAQGWFVRLMLAPKEGGQTDRVVELTRSRARMADAFQAERRRIERDLHDGAQQRLVALVMTLGLAEMEFGGTEPKGGRAGELISRARGRRSRRWTNCATWSAASIRRSSPTTASPPRCPRSRYAAGCRWMWTWSWPGGCPRRSRPPPTSSSARRSPTSSSTAVPRPPRCTGG
ncbi:sensor domain-containing protein [Streptomyces sp. Ac-502]|uniref:sensor histidine kinase n=1 Tax=Streptomyces sp. Ac-502 TaxID=3342801 RepID=UPI0038622CB5